jgi:hypothetical protein
VVHSVYSLHKTSTALKIQESGYLMCIRRILDAILYNVDLASTAKSDILRRND